MKIKKYNYHTFELSTKERDALQIVDALLKDVQDTFFDDAEFHSQINGDIITVDELSRVRGILDFFEQNVQIFTIEDVCKGE